MAQRCPVDLDHISDVIEVVDDDGPPPDSTSPNTYNENENENNDLDDENMVNMKMADSDTFDNDENRESPKLSVSEDSI